MLDLQNAQASCPCTTIFCSGAAQRGQRWILALAGCGWLSINLPALSLILLAQNIHACLEALNAFNSFFAETKRFPITTEVFEGCKTSNKTSVSLRLMTLVEMGYLGAYQKGNKFIWCNRAEADRL
jgi:hypothetical protein